MKFPLYLPQINNPQNDGLSVLAADVGGTKPISQNLYQKTENDSRVRRYLCYQ